MTGLTSKIIIVFLLLIFFGGIAVTKFREPIKTISTPPHNKEEIESSVLPSSLPTVFSIDPDTQCDETNNWVFENKERSARVDFKGLENNSCLFELTVAVDGKYETTRCSIELGHLHSTFTFDGNHFEIAEIEHHCVQLETGPIGL